jgi:hypothetical protein
LGKASSGVTTFYIPADRTAAIYTWLRLDGEDQTGEGSRMKSQPIPYALRNGFASFLGLAPLTEKGPFYPTFCLPPTRWTKWMEITILATAQAKGEFQRLYLPQALMTATLQPGPPYLAGRFGIMPVKT